MSAEPTTTAPTGNEAPASQTLNEREVRTLANGFRALEASAVIDRLKLVNFDKMAAHMGITNKDSARNSLKKILEKLTQAEENGEVIKTASNKPAATAATPRKRAAARNRTIKAATDEPAAADTGAGADNHEDEDALLESPSKRPRTASAKNISVTKPEDGEAANGEDGVSREDVLAAAESAAGGAAGAKATRPRASRKNGMKAENEGDTEPASAPKNEAGIEDANDGDGAPTVPDTKPKKSRAPRKTKAEKEAEAAAAAAAVAVAAADAAADDGEAAAENNDGADTAEKPKKSRASRKNKTNEADAGAAEGKVVGNEAKPARKKPAPRGKKAAAEAKEGDKSENEGEGAEDEAKEGKKATTRGGKKAAAAAKDEEEKKASEKKASEKRASEKRASEKKACKKSATPAASAAEKDGSDDGAVDSAVDGAADVKDAGEHANGTKDKDLELSDAPDIAETAEDEASGESMEF